MHCITTSSSTSTHTHSHQTPAIASQRTRTLKISVHTHTHCLCACAPNGVSKYVHPNAPLFFPLSLSLLLAKQGPPSSSPLFLSLPPPPSFFGTSSYWLTDCKHCSCERVHNHTSKQNLGPLEVSLACSSSDNSSHHRRRPPPTLLLLHPLPRAPKWEQRKEEEDERKRERNKYVHTRRKSISQYSAARKNKRHTQKSPSGQDTKFN